MKKLTTLLLAAGLVFAASAPASAVDVKMDGVYDFAFVSQSKGLQGQNLENAAQRIRLGMTFTASENLSGYFQMQVGTDEWGTHTNIDYNGDKHGNGISARQAYIDWIIPQTDVKVRMGRSIFGLPKDAFGNNAIMDAWVPQDGVVVSAPVTDWMSVNAFWARTNIEQAYDEIGSLDVANGQRNDVFGLAADLKFDGVSVSPYVMYAAMDKGAGTYSLNDDLTVKQSSSLQYSGDKDAHMYAADSNAYWFGVTSTISYFDPFTLKVSGAYGAKEYEGNDFGDRKGWYAQAKASYKTAYGTPIFGGWYASGDDANDYLRQGWIPTVGGRFLAANTFTDGSFGCINGIANVNVAGTWGLQAGWTGMSFLEDLTHDFTVTMFKGTNNTNMVTKNGVDADAYTYMTTSDTAYEFALVNYYQIYKNLVTVLEVAYILNDFDDSAAMEGVRGVYDKDDWKVALNFQYKF